MSDIIYTPSLSDLRNLALAAAIGFPIGSIANGAAPWTRVDGISPARAPSR